MNALDLFFWMFCLMGVVWFLSWPEENCKIVIGVIISPVLLIIVIIGGLYQLAKYLLRTRTVPAIECQHEYNSTYRDVPSCIHCTKKF